MDAVTSAEKVESPVADSTNSLSSGLLNKFSGLLSKGVDTALDVWAIKESGKAIGTVYPTGQVDPAAAKSNNVAEQQTAAQTQNIAKYMPWIIGGGVVLVLLVGGVALMSARKN